MALRRLAPIMLLIAVACAALIAATKRQQRQSPETPPLASLKRMSTVAGEVVLWQSDHHGLLPNSIGVVAKDRNLSDIAGISYRLTNGGKNFRITHVDQSTGMTIIADQTGLIWPVHQLPEH